MTSENNAHAVVTALVGAGLVDPGRQAEADVVARSALERTGSEISAPLRRRMAEIAGYVGGAFVVGAAILFFSSTWSDLSLDQQVGLLLGTAAVLIAAGVGFVIGAGGRAALRTPEESVRRRLTSVLFTGAAAAAAFGVGLMLSDSMANEELAVMLAALTAAVVALGGYVVAPTTVGQLGTAVALFVMVPTGLGALGSDDPSTLTFGLIVLAIGAAWVVAAERGLWLETLSARLIGCTLAVIGAQVAVFGDQSWVGYLATAAVGAIAFWLYVGSRAWPYLATGVVAVTLAVPEALDDWFGDSVPAAGLLLAAGVTLLAAALLGFRLRQEVHEDEASSHTLGHGHAHAH
ncbi:MAG: hypothetical protein ACXWDI_02870 [Nocardioides sp.]